MGRTWEGGGASKELSGFSLASVPWELEGQEATWGESEQEFENCVGEWERRVGLWDEMVGKTLATLAKEKVDGIEMTSAGLTPTVGKKATPSGHVGLYIPRALVY